MPVDPVHDWLDALVARHTSALSRPEFLKAVRALSARYVERRAEIPRRSPVDSAGKRAAFAAFFAPLHLLTAREVARALGADEGLMPQLIDLGCGTGAASAGWALACDRPPDIVGIDRHAWSLDEAAWNWRSLGLRARTRRADLVHAVAELTRRPRPAQGTSVARGLEHQRTGRPSAARAPPGPPDTRGPWLPGPRDRATGPHGGAVVEGVGRHMAAPWGAGRRMEVRTGAPACARRSQRRGRLSSRLARCAHPLASAAVAPCYDRSMESGAPAPTDAELVDGLRAGDPRTFEILVRNEGPEDALRHPADPQGR